MANINSFNALTEKILIFRIKNLISRNLILKRQKRFINILIVTSLTNILNSQICHQDI